MTDGSLASVTVVAAPGALIGYLGLVLGLEGLGFRVGTAEKPLRTVSTVASQR